MLKHLEIVDNYAFPSAPRSANDLGMVQEMKDEDQEVLADLEEEEPLEPEIIGLQDGQVPISPLQEHQP